MRSVFLGILLAAALSSQLGAAPASPRGTVELLLVSDGHGGVVSTLPDRRTSTGQFCIWQVDQHQENPDPQVLLSCFDTKPPAYSYYCNRYPGSADTAVVLLNPRGKVLYARSLDEIPDCSTTK